ncbi:hypothetical protein EXIGUO8H_280001 [Exiguobacterium sp. 8H]|uniref:hypothetical protein n=1 Tax=unclassified Exiguobacterium TaxID=2644629 RepID=UPI0012F30A2B|nr:MULTISPECIES: hypothetical protein [unclassified Exiguobacterium]VXB82074.1 hypothetical protein EXIGUO8H_280001 [Exiguobacterium sp. 8H]VXB97503.1 hypothetical protein EXIGUO8A_410004 [Exiguobacterium sp. 8A]
MEWSNFDALKLIEHTEHNLSSEEALNFVKRHWEMENEHETFIRRTFHIEDIELIYLNEKIKVFETRYKNGEWVFLRVDGGWL